MTSDIDRVIKQLPQVKLHVQFIAPLLYKMRWNKNENAVIAWLIENILPNQHTRLDGFAQAHFIRQQVTLNGIL